MNAVMKSEIHDILFDSTAIFLDNSLKESGLFAMVIDQNSHFLVKCPIMRDPTWAVRNRMPWVLENMAKELLRRGYKVRYIEDSAGVNHWAHPHKHLLDANRSLFYV